MEKVFEEKQAGERKLNEVMTKLHTNFAIEKLAAVESARAEEQGIAHINATETAKWVTITYSSILSFCALTFT